MRPEPLDASTERDRARHTPTGIPASGRTPTRVTPAGGVPLVAATANDADAAAERARTHLAAGDPEAAVREAASAMRLAPDSFDHQALHAWAVFLAARDRAAAADAARKVFEKASHRATAPNEVRFLLGRLERMVGREREALRHFRAVLDRDPGHAAAAAELRELEAELEAFARR
jgi:tetratricopeptide (TPR) repeat protein